MITAIITACASKRGNYQVRWNASQTLPQQQDGQRHLGVAGPITGVIGDHLIVAGGANFPAKKPWEGGAKQYPQELYIFKIDGDHISLQSKRYLDKGVAYSGNCSVNDALYTAGGESKNGIIAETRKFTFQQDSLSQENLADLPQPLTNGSLVAANNRLYYIGGENQDHVSDKIYSLELSSKTNQWKEAYTLPYPLTHAVVVSNNVHKIYIAGGRKRNDGALSTIYDKVLAIDIASGATQEIGRLPEPLAAGTGILDSSGDLFIFGGDNAETFHKVETIIAELNKTTDPVQKERLNAQKAQLQNDHPGFSHQSWSYDIGQKKWYPLSPVAGESPVTTSAIIYGDQIIIPSGEKRAGVRTDQILIGKIDRN